MWRAARENVLKIDWDRRIARAQQGRPGSDHLFLVDQEGTHYIDCSDVPLTYYADLVSDVRERTTTACPQTHTLEVMRLALEVNSAGPGEAPLADGRVEPGYSGLVRHGMMAA